MPVAVRDSCRICNAKTERQRIYPAFKGSDGMDCSCCVALKDVAVNGFVQIIYEGWELLIGQAPRISPFHSAVRICEPAQLQP